MSRKAKSNIRISVITWDASFREHFHTVDSFGRQDYPPESFEFIWVDYYKNENPRLLESVAKYPNARVLNLDRPKDEQWHLGRCLNAGIKEAKGEVLVIPDGDIIVPKDILRIIEQEHKSCDSLALYFRRWDEPAKFHDDVKSYDIEHLKDVCVLVNPINYAGLLSVKKDNLEQLNNYEESEIFSGPGANGLELYTRLRNHGFLIKWGAEKIYHPYHEMTGYSPTDKKMLTRLARQHSWISAYAGLPQSWTLKQRETDLSYVANDGSIEGYLATIPSVEELLKAVHDSESEVERLKGVISAQQKNNEVKDALLAQRDEEVRKRSEWVKNLGAEVERLKGVVETKQKTVEDKNALLAQRDEEVRKHVEYNDKVVAERDALVIDSDKLVIEIKKITVMLHELEAEKQLFKEESYKLLHEEVKALENLNAVMLNKHNDVAMELAALRSEDEVVKDRINQKLKTVSMKITAPARWLAALLRKIC